jgi:hypothetical protein
MPKLPKEVIRAALVAHRDAVVIKPGYDRIDYEAAMEAAIVAALAEIDKAKTKTSPWQCQ